MNTPINNFYLTTAIAYTNGPPHFGHAYEIICADILARYHTLFNKNVFFTTGTDEHGTKISDTAKSLNISPIELCDKYVLEFQNLYKMLNINTNKFIRTTGENHKAIAKLVWANAKQDIYFGEYTGWYCVREERFFTETEAKNYDYIDQSSGKPLIKRAESSYFFRLSKYQDAIINHILNNPDFILPQSSREEILTRLTTDKLEDLSISRTKLVMDWGIEIDDEHVMYVWFDALINYLSVIDYPNGTNFMFWPANIHLIGKDICWFHTVIWSAMLMSVNLTLPKTILAHGFVNDIKGYKMSKSIGNVIDPIKLLEKYDPDVIRMYLAYTTNIGADLNVSMTDIDIIHDSLLAAKFSNLANRCLVLTTKLNNNVIPEGNCTELFSIDTLKTEIYEKLKLFKIKDILGMLFSHLDIINKYLTDLQPWLQKESYLNVLRTILEGIYIIGTFLSPFIPNTINKLCGFMNINTCDNFDNLTWNNLKPGAKLNDYTMLFKKIKTRFDITEIEKQNEKIKIEQRKLEKKNKKLNNKK